MIHARHATEAVRLRRFNALSWEICRFGLLVKTVKEKARHMQRNAQNAMVAELFRKM